MNQDDIVQRVAIAVQIGPQRALAALRHEQRGARRTHGGADSPTIRSRESEVANRTRTCIQDVIDVVE